MQVFLTKGIPGCGKSSWAKALPGNNLILSADNYHLDAEGVYKFDPANLKKAHDYCFKAFTEQIWRVSGGGCPFTSIVVDNTNLKVFEFAPYYRLAEAFGFEVEIVQFIIDPLLAARRNVHGVPEGKVIEMAKGMEAVPPWWKVTYVAPREQELQDQRDFEKYN